VQSSKASALCKRPRPGWLRISLTSNRRIPRVHTSLAPTQHQCNARVKDLATAAAAVAEEVVVAEVELVEAVVADVGVPAVGVTARQDSVVRRCPCRGMSASSTSLTKGTNYSLAWGGMVRWFQHNFVVLALLNYCCRQKWSGAI
jgi:hypothetical protein